MVEFVQEVLHNTEDRAWKAFETRFRDVFIFLNMHPDNIRILDQYELMVDADKKAEEEISKLKKSAPEKITKIAIETSSELIQKLIGADVNNSSISAIVDDLSKKNQGKYYDN